MKVRLDGKAKQVYLIAFYFISNQLRINTRKTQITAAGNWNQNDHLENNLTFPCFLANTRRKSRERVLYNSPRSSRKANHRLWSADHKYFIRTSMKRYNVFANIYVRTIRRSLFFAGHFLFVRSRTRISNYHLSHLVVSAFAIVGNFSQVVIFRIRPSFKLFVANSLIITVRGI